MPDFLGNGPPQATETTDGAARTRPSMTFTLRPPLSVPVPVPPSIVSAARLALSRDPQALVADTTTRHSAWPSGEWIECRCARCRTHYGDQLVFGSATIVLHCTRSECRRASADRTILFVGATPHPDPGLRDAPPDLAR